MYSMYVASTVLHGEVVHGVMGDGGHIGMYSTYGVHGSVVGWWQGVCITP